MCRARGSRGRPHPRTASPARSHARAPSSYSAFTTKTDRSSKQPLARFTIGIKPKLSGYGSELASLPRVRPILQEPRDAQLFEKKPHNMAPKMAGMPKARKGDLFSRPSENTVASFVACGPGEHIALVALKSQGQLNGRCGFVGAFDGDSGRFEAWLSPMQLSVGATGGLKVNWVNTDADGGRKVVRVKPENMQKLNMPQAAGNDAAFEALAPEQKVAVLCAQSSLYNEASFYKDGNRRSPNVIAVFRAEHAHNSVWLVERPQPGVIPGELGGRALVVRRELNMESEGVGGYVYVIASEPRVLMAYRASADLDGEALTGKQGADRYLKMMQTL